MQKNNSVHVTKKKEVRLKIFAIVETAQVKDYKYVEVMFNRVGRIEQPPMFYFFRRITSDTSEETII